MFDSKTLFAVEAIYEAAGETKLWPRALEAVSRCLDSLGTVVLLLQQDESTASIVSPALVDAQKEYAAGAWKTDYLASRVLELSVTSDRNCYTEHDLTSPDEMRTHPFYTDFRSRFKLGSVITSVLLPHPQLPVVIAIQGGDGRPAFTNREIELCEYLFRHVEKALRLTVRLLQAESGQLAMAEVLSKVSCGVFMLDGERRVLFQNTKASELLGGDLAVVDEILHIEGTKTNIVTKAFQSYNDFSDGTSKKLDPIVVMGKEQKPLVLHVLPFRKQNISENVFLNARSIMLVIENSFAEPVDPGLIRDLLGLTLGEARLASLVGAGQSPRTAADKLNITEETARTVLKRVFSKTGVSRQSELSALLSNSLLNIGA